MKLKKLDGDRERTIRRHCLKQLLFRSGAFPLSSHPRGFFPLSPSRSFSRARGSTIWEGRKQSEPGALLESELKNYFGDSFPSMNTKTKPYTWKSLRSLGRSHPHETLKRFFDSFGQMCVFYARWRSGVDSRDDSSTFRTPNCDSSKSCWSPVLLALFGGGTSAQRGD